MCAHAQRVRPAHIHMPLERPAGKGRKAQAWLLDRDAPGAAAGAAGAGDRADLGLRGTAAIVEAGWTLLQPAGSTCGLGRPD
jgi:hypothetical protein